LCLRSRGGVEASLSLTLSRLSYYLTFQTFDFECTWGRIFKKRIMHTKSDIYVFDEKWKWNNLKMSFGPFYVKNIKIWWKINSLCTNNRNIHFNILGPLVIIWLSKHLILSVLEEGYSRNGSCTLNQIFMFLTMWLKKRIVFVLCYDTVDRLVSVR
jgi:hypothetical protein